jgi:hypothetical protein
VAPPTWRTSSSAAAATTSRHTTATAGRPSWRGERVSAAGVLRARRGRSRPSPGCPG